MTIRMEDEAAVFASGRSAHWWPPIVIERPPRAERRRLKVIAFNACSGRFVSEIAARLRRPPLDNPDVILLSEADWRLRRSGRHEVAAELAAELGMSFTYFGEFALPPATGAPSSFMGNAILASRPLNDVRPLPLATLFLHRRVRRLLGAPAGIAATIVVNRRAISLGVAHLNSRCNPLERERQITQFLQGFPEDGPAILGGDFNTTTVGLRSPVDFIEVMALALMHPRRLHHPHRWEPLFQRLQQAGFDVRGANAPAQPTFTPSRWVPPVLRPKLDWLALRGLKAISGSAAVVPARRSFWSRRFSDHDFVMCEVPV